MCARAQCVPRASALRAALCSPSASALTMATTPEIASTCSRQARDLHRLAVDSLRPCFAVLRDFILKRTLSIASRTARSSTTCTQFYDRHLMARSSIARSSTTGRLLMARSSTTGTLLMARSSTTGKKARTARRTTMDVRAEARGNTLIRFLKATLGSN